VPGAVIPKQARTTWAREIDRLVSDAPELNASVNPTRWESVKGGIRWALGPENLGTEYEVVIRSGRSLREKWPKLRAAAKRVETKRVPSQAEFERMIRDG
jgi:hypothetical protein